MPKPKTSKKKSSRKAVRVGVVTFDAWKKMTMALAHRVSERLDGQRFINMMEAFTSEAHAAIEADKAAAKKAAQEAAGAAAAPDA